MPTFEQGTVVRVPFPYAGRATRQHRPALVVSNGAVGERAHLLWVAMITSAENRRWPGDVEIVDDHRAAGLPAPSIVRPSKIATIEAAHAEPIGRLDADRTKAVMAVLRATLEAATPD